MKQTHLLIVLVLILASTNAVATTWTPEAGVIAYQINHSDRIIVGNVTDIQQYYDYSLVTIEVDEWLVAPLPSENITVITKMGTNVAVMGEPTFSENETVLLMLKDLNVSENRFEVVFGEPGKHPLSDKDIILRELGFENETTEFISGNETTLELESENETDEEIPSNETPFIGLVGMSIAVSSAFLLLRKYD